MSDATGPAKVIFVGGAPRSGTSVTHALLCTAPASNPYHPEISFIRPIFQSYALGLHLWQSHTNAFFQIPEHLKMHVGTLAEQSLLHVWRVLKKPEVLCVKDPLLTKDFPSVNAVMQRPCQFVTVLRHPHDVVRSQQEVYSRAGVPMVEGTVRKLSVEYMESYAHLNKPEMEGRAFHFRYEDLGNDWLIEQLHAFTGLNGIDSEQIWNSGKHVPSEAEKADPFFSPKYHRPINTERRFDRLKPEFQSIVNEVCLPLMESSGYLKNGDVEAW
ncbi:sulfotransferase family protein [Szabonella alba]|uniref:Sulfotransferase n=1 Tax=Szabonella alba TaxID=2804194 RepID=A0A8K0VBX1_9RHOB|nr:sulfotransferase [Szabonella alba]MBL4919344.1 sulfotransferase [Szabonella alba]